MSSQQPPIIPGSVTTPSTEWAQQTFSAVDNAAEATKGNAPHNQGRVPGAFPGDVSKSDEEEFTMSAKQTLESAQKTAQDMYASAGQGAQNVMSSAEQAARQYLPQGVVDKLEQVGVLGAAGSTQTQGQATSSSIEQKIAQYDATHHDSRPSDATSLPSHETGPFHPTHGGVGTLPGKPNEAGVAKLPEERTQELRNELPTHESGQFKPTHGGVGSLPGSKDEVGVAELPDEKRAKRINERDYENPKELSQLRQELPTRETDNRPTHGGVGSLPGSKDEAGVAVLPDEKNTGYQTATKGSGEGGFATSAGHYASTTQSVPFQPLAGYSGSALTHTAQDVPGTHRAAPAVPKDREYGIGATGPAVVAQGGGHGAPPVHPERKNERTSYQDPNQGQDEIGATGPAGVAQGGGHSAPPVHPERKNEQTSYQDPKQGQDEKNVGKVGFGTKLKADAKIIGGKVLRDEEKVQEGRAMKNPN
ncbi:hypothetical protein M422DRAFT_32979 [Sphaerobolus stellatus SS14]|uniref:Uncharacterized protein n=1 Tax=Sphaerobolus stellatus (strain SS14) TaxID=990650 RepID=A0A0C9UVQ2_SPHS4|nr:hypothetical protein M422DRAFT_32979 [Sphaerobolus stellatus SS14]